jgi:hypothetical protein
LDVTFDINALELSSFIVINWALYRQNKKKRRKKIETRFVGINRELRTTQVNSTLVEISTKIYKALYHHGCSRNVFWDESISDLHHLFAEFISWCRRPQTPPSPAKYVKICAENKFGTTDISWSVNHLDYLIN